MPAGGDEAEVEALRARIPALERDSFSTAARTNEAIAGAQEEAYWLARWGVDLDALLRGPHGRAVRWLARGLRR